MYGENLVLLNLLLKCLHKNLMHLNETSPFALTPNPQILYNIELSEVVSLSFDGILTFKAYIFLTLKRFFFRSPRGRQDLNRNEFPLSVIAIK